MNRARKLAAGYRSAGVIIANTLVLVLLLNVLLGVGYWVKDGLSGDEASAASGRLFDDNGAPVATERRTRVQLQWFDFQAADEYDPEFVADVLSDFYDLERLGFVYQPWVQFSEPPYDGRRVHVDLDERGFPIRRTTNRATTDGRPVVRIFTMGGSTSFGYHVADQHTWPSYLSRILNARARSEGREFRVEVINYGRGYYHPSQETVLLADLLKLGHRPSLVIFMDGVNWGARRDQPHFKPEVAQAFLARQHGTDISAGDLLAEFRWVPMVRLTSTLNRWLDARFVDRQAGKDGLAVDTEDRLVQYAVNQFRQNRRIAEATCALYGCETLFYLQPNALYRYDLELYRRENLPTTFTSLVEPTARLYEWLREDEGYIDLSHLFELWGADRKAIVDDIHYSPAFNGFLAERVAQDIDLGSLPVFKDPVDESSATGDVRSVVTQDGRIQPPRAPSSMRRSERTDESRTENGKS